MPNGHFNFRFVELKFSNSGLSALSHAAKSIAAAQRAVTDVVLYRDFAYSAIILLG